MDKNRRNGIISIIVFLVSIGIFLWLEPFKSPDSTILMILGQSIRVIMILSAIASVIYSIMMIAKKDYAYGIVIFLLTVFLLMMLLWPIRAHI